MLQIGEVELLGVVDPNSVPTVLVPPGNTTVNEGGTATFSVTTVGPGTIGYLWYNVTAGEPGTLVPGQHTATLTLTGITAAMSGNTYRVVVTKSVRQCCGQPSVAQPRGAVDHRQRSTGGADGYSHRGAGLCRSHHSYARNYQRHRAIHPPLAEERGQPWFIREVCPRPDHSPGFRPLE